jgi:hypothetical protein
MGMFDCATALSGSIFPIAREDQRTAVSTSTGMTTSSLPGASGYYVTSTLKKT